MKLLPKIHSFPKPARLYPWWVDAMWIAFCLLALIAFLVLL